MTPKTGRLTTQPYADEIHAAQLAALRRNFTFSLMGAWLTAVLIVIVLQDVVPLRERLAWLGANALVALVRGVLALRYYDRCVRAPGAARVAGLHRWVRAMVWSTMAAGALIAVRL